MAATNKKLTTAVEDYLTDLQRIRASGGATGERSRYAPLANLLNTVGGVLKSRRLMGWTLPLPLRLQQSQDEK